MKRTKRIRRALSDAEMAVAVEYGLLNLPDTEIRALVALKASQDKFNAHLKVLFEAHPRTRKPKRKGAVGEVTRYLRAERRPGEKAGELWERLKALGASDEQPIYFDGDEMIVTRTGKVISYPAFEKRLVPHKTR